MDLITWIGHVTLLALFLRYLVPLVLDAGVEVAVSWRKFHATVFPPEAPGRPFFDPSTEPDHPAHRMWGGVPGTWPVPASDLRILGDLDRTPPPGPQTP